MIGLALMFLGGAALARLSESAPKGVTLDGDWNLDPGESDDSEAAVEKARENRRGSGSDAGAPGGGGFHQGAGRRGAGGGGGGRRGHPGAAQDDSSATGPSDKPSGSDTSTHSRDDILTELAKSPDRLSVQSKDGTMIIGSEANAVACDAGGKSAIEDNLGDAERTCGWDGRAWIVETNRGRSGLRSDRYELSKDGKTLTYTTLVTGGRFPKLKLMRVYHIAPA